jgi:Sulfatase-modifying factor enzyme 1/Protein kinase domain
MPDPEATRTEASAPAAGEPASSLAGGSAPTAVPAGGPPTPAPATVGPYRLVKKLGEGGFGAVWLADDERLHRQVALKVLRAELAASPVFRERFLCEGRAMAAVDSDHVVTVFDTGDDNGVPYIAIKLMAGEPLDSWLDANPKPPLAEVLRIGRETALGLTGAHERGLIHRDIKPSNLWRKPAGARHRADEHRPSPRHADVHGPGAVGRQERRPPLRPVQPRGGALPDVRRAGAVPGVAPGDRGRHRHDHPVVKVSYADAEKFCRWLTRQTGRKFELPTEAEWECACRGGTTTAYYFGPALNGRQANCDGRFPFGTDQKGPEPKGTTPVGSYEAEYPHPWGLCDVHGNVWQWCRDWYDADFYKRSPADNPLCDDGARTHRVVRGGSWNYFCWYARSAHRRRLGSDSRVSYVGFRVSFRLA